MKKITCVLAILAAASTAAGAKDLKQDKKAAAPAVSATQMSDAEMDKVTAGGPPVSAGTNISTIGVNGSTGCLSSSLSGQCLIVGTDFQLLKGAHAGTAIGHSSVLPSSR
jgi:hypothetical protein